MLRLPFLLLLAWLPFGGRAQTPAPAAPDTVQLTLPAAEQQFAENNLQLLAQRYNVSVAEAQVVQARLWDNPTFSLEQNAFNQQTHHVFDMSRQGNTAVQVQQLFALAGRRRAAARLAEEAALVQQFTLQDLLRTLSFQLRTAFYDLYYQQQNLAVYDREIASFSRTVALYQGQFQKGNIALKEVIRLKAFLFQLENERQGLLSDMAAEQADLRTLLRTGSTTAYRPVVDPGRLRALSLAGRTLQQLIDSAEVARADVQASRAAVEQQNRNLRYQRALATPDLAVGGLYDRSGNYIPNYTAVTLGLAVPVFNRNQGNIKAARAQVQVSQAQLSQQQLVVENDVQQAWQQAQQTDQLFQASDRDTGDFDRLMRGIDESYAKRNLTLVEFLDFYESYKNNLVQRNTLRANRVRAFEQLNYAVGRPLFHAN